jgi:hypothetical protein
MKAIQTHYMRTGNFSQCVERVSERVRQEQVIEQLSE